MSLVKIRDFCDGGVAPEFLKIVMLTCQVVENVDKDVSIVNDNPFWSPVTVVIIWFYVYFLKKGIPDTVGDSRNLSWGVCLTDYELECRSTFNFREVEYRYFFPFAILNRIDNKRSEILCIMCRNKYAE